MKTLVAIALLLSVTVYVAALECNERMTVQGIWKTAEKEVRNRQKEDSDECRQLLPNLVKAHPECRFFAVSYCHEVTANGTVVDYRKWFYDKEEGKCILLVRTVIPVLNETSYRWTLYEIQTPKQLDDAVHYEVMPGTKDSTNRGNPRTSYALHYIPPIALDWP